MLILSNLIMYRFPYDNEDNDDHDDDHDDEDDDDDDDDDDVTRSCLD